MSSIAQLVPRSASSAGQAGRRGKASEQVTRRVGGTKKKKQAPGASRDALKAKEEEYRRRNAELEAKTAELVKEAEHLMKGNLSILSDLETSDSAPPTSEHQQRPTSTLDSSPHPSPFTSSHPHTTQSHPELPNPHPPDQPSHPHTSHPHTSHPHTLRPHTTNTNQKPKKTLKTQPEIKKPSSHTRGEIPLVKPVISLAVETVVQQMEENLEAGVGEGVGLGYHGDDIIPEAAEEMGSEALIRFLKAKLRVTQEELDRLCGEMGSKDKQLQSSETKLKELTEQNNRLQRTHQSLQSQLDKHKATAEAMKHKSSGLEAQLVGLRKDIEGMRGQQKKAAGHHSALEVRLNRAVEETEKYKMELASLRTRADDSSKSERLTMEQLAAENKQLERQRNELMAAFKKQMKLIDILKRQKMHIEAAKLLSFTEEEFVKALDWQAS